MRWLASAILVSTMVLGWCAGGSAQVLEQLELNPYVAGNAHTKNEFEVGFPQSTTPISEELRFDRTLSGGIRFNVHNSGHFGEEFFYSFEHNEAHIVRTTAPSQQLDLGIQIHNFGVNGLFYFNDNEKARTRPFLSFGLGATMYRPTTETRAIVRDPQRGNLPGFGQSNEFAFNYGAGLKQRLGGVFGLRLDVRHFMGRSPSFSLPRHSDDPNATVFPAEGAIHSLEASVGLVFYFKK